MKYHSAIVTGASSGIGRAISKQLCLQGVKVYAISRSKKDLDEVKNSLPESIQENFKSVKCDITKTPEVHKQLGKIFSTQKIDLIINNAGVGYSRKFIDYSDNEIDRVIATNIRGTITVTQTSLKLRDVSLPLHIVNTTSLAGKMGFPELSVYTATKFAIEGLTESLYQEYKNQNVSFTILRPGITDTAFFSKAGMQVYKEGVKDLNSFYSPEQVADELLNKLRSGRNSITIGNDKLFIPLLPFIPLKFRFKMLDIINKI